MSPLLSIITVIKPPADGFEATRASVLREFGGDANVEYIVKEWSVDPGIQETEDSQSMESGLPIRFLKGADKGVFEGMNQALEFAKGKWILFLNAGDWLASGIGDVLLSTIRRSSDTDYIFLDGVTVDAADRREFLRPAPESLQLRDFLIRVPVLHPCLLVRKEYFGAGFDLKYDLAADFALLVQLVAENRVGKHIPYVGAFVLSGGLSEQHRLRARRQAVSSLLAKSPEVRFRFEVLASHLRFLVIHLLTTKLIRVVPIFRKWAKSRTGGYPEGTFTAGNERS